MPKWTIAKAKRGHTLSEVAPSAADYSPRSVVSRVPAYTIGNGLRSEMLGNKEAPGPGAYEIGRECSGPKFTIVAKHESPAKETAPGPADYNNNGILYKKKSPSAVFGTSKKNCFVPNEVPGPGNYRISRSLKGPRYSFSKQKRYSQKTETVPGPGQYEIPNTIGTARNSALNNTFT